jgi:hypothetical protein
MIGVLASMVKDGTVTSDLVAGLGPYTRERIRRLIRSQLDDLPGILEPQPLPFEAAL